MKQPMPTPNALSILQVPPDLWNLHMSTTADKARAGLPIIQKLAKKNWRRLVLENHPDTGGNAEDFQRIQDAWDVIKNLKVTERPPMEEIRIHFASQFGIRVNTSATGTTSNPIFTFWGNIS